MKTSQANRGKQLETLIDHTNRIYKQKGWGLIQKIHTPVKVITRNNQIIKSWFDKKSTVDYIGVAHGRHIAFDAKTTKEKRLPLDMIGTHQIDFLTHTKDQGGIAFILAEFRQYDERYIVPIEMVSEAVKQAGQGGRKSIPYQTIAMECDLVKSTNGVPVDYLKALKVV